MIYFRFSKGGMYGFVNLTNSSHPGQIMNDNKTIRRGIMRVQRIPVLLISLVTFCMLGCSGIKGGRITSSVSSEPLDRLWTTMAGHYDSADQAIADSQYHHISLSMVPVRLSDTTYRWLYVEQALGSSPVKPYRIRLYRLEAMSPGRFVSRVYTFKDETVYGKVWEDPERKAALDTATILEREGCAVFIREKGEGMYEGATAIGTCESSLRGARYASSEVWFDATEMRSWDRGYDAFGNQVWGAVSGPYIFKKRRSTSRVNK